jgi:hypothetical protein
VSSPRKRLPKPKKPKQRGPRPGSNAHYWAELSEKERRIEEIAAKMQSGAWLSGVSDRALAEQWDCAPNTVRKFAAEASRLLRRQLRMDPEAQKEALAQILQTFEVIRAKAMAKNSEQGLRVALDATRAFGFYMGVEPAQKLAIKENTDPFEGWSVEEKLAFANDGTKPKRAMRRLAGEFAAGETNGADPDAESMH